MKTFGEMVRERRLELKLTQKELCEGICTATTISYIESDKFYPSAKILQQLATKLQLTPNDLLAVKDANIEIEVLVKLATFYEMNGQYDLFFALCEKLEKREMTNVQRYNLMLSRAVALFKSQETPTEAIEIVHELLRNIEYRDGLERLTAEAYNKLGAFKLKVPSYHGAYYAYTRAYKIAVELPEHDQLYAKICYNLGLTCNALGYTNESMKYLAESSKMFNQYSDFKSLALSYFDLSHACRDRGDWKEAEWYITQAIQLFDATNTVHLANRAREYHAFHFISKSSLEDAIHILSDCAQEAVAMGDRTSLAYYQARIASLCVQAGDVERAEEYVMRAMKMFPEEVVDADYAYVLRIRGQVYILKQKLENGVTCCLKSAELFDKMDLLADSIDSLQIVATAYRELEMFKESTEIWEQIAELAAKRRFGVKL